jgi:hypothetical protein
MPILPCIRSSFFCFRNGFLAASSQEYAAHIAYILRCDFLTFLRDKEDFQKKFCKVFIMSLFVVWSVSPI